jgi:hypothetical protein
MRQEIIFRPNTVIQSEYYPQPADKFIPNWYKEVESYMGSEKKPTGNGNTSGTIKKCMPVFDAITSGYIISLPADVFVTQKDGAPYYEWASLGLVDFHPVEQAPNHPANNGFVYPKWINPWAIKTPKGYSTLFVQPFHRSSVFAILPGVVDTDTYDAPVNFPFVLNDPKFEGLVPAGTPIAQLIPIKRSNWKSTIKEYDSNWIDRTTVRLKTKMFDSYKNQFWTKKEYK